MNKVNPITIGIMILIGIWMVSSTVQNVATAPEDGVVPAEKEPGLFKRLWRFAFRAGAHAAVDEAIDGVFEGKQPPRMVQSFAPIHRPSEFLAGPNEALKHGRVGRWIMAT